MLKKLTLIFILLLGTISVFAQDIPDKDLPAKSNSLVSDYANVLSPGDQQQLERKLDDYNDSTSTQIAIVLIKSIGQYDIDAYGTALGRKWAIGEKGKNNGLLILAAIDDHKVAIQTGYGMEGSIPDAITNQIINEDIRPHFRQQPPDYYGGLDQATTDIIKYARGEYKGNPQRHNGGGSGAGIIVFFIIIVILIIIFRNRGGGGQIIGGRGGASPFWWFIAGDMLGSSGRGGGGGWGGFSGGGDSGGGGGFGGFGGGSFGGGGSSGSW